MARPRKNITTTGGSPVENALAAMTNVAKKTRVGGVGFRTIAQSADDWRWIDFIDPKTNLPALLLEYLWGSRGMLAGRMLKLEAEEGVGKSSYCMLQYAMGVRTANAWCIHLEGEEAAAPPDFIASFGVDPNKIMSPEFDRRSIDECFNKLDLMAHYIRRKPNNDKDTDIIDPDMKYPIIAGIDSISSFGTAANMDDAGGSLDTGQGGLGLHSRFLSQWFRDKWTVQTRRQMFLIAVTQLREKIEIGGFPGGPKPAKGGKTTIAARPLNYHASYRLEMRSKPFRRRSSSDAIGPVIGELITMTTTKNKMSPKGKQIEIPLIWDEGFELAEATVDLLCRLSPIQLREGYVFEIGKTGGWLKCPALSEKSLQFSVDTYPQVCLDLLNLLYSNQDLLMCIREAFRVRGFGFQFEQNYIPTAVELEDLTQTEDQAATTEVLEA